MLKCTCTHTHFLFLQKHKYKTTLSSVRALHSTFEPPAGPNSAHSTSVSADIIEGDLLPNELSHTHLSQLRHMQQLMNVQCEKTDREIQRKVAKIGCDKLQIQQQIRYMVYEIYTQSVCVCDGSYAV